MPGPPPLYRGAFVNIGGALCARCRGAGHCAQECRTRICAKCAQRGHTHETCRAAYCAHCRAYVTSHREQNCRHAFCTRCERAGHSRDACWADDTQLWCSACSGRGHVSADCAAGAEYAAGAPH